MTDITGRHMPSTDRPPRPLLHLNLDWLPTLFLTVGVFAAVVGSLCIGAFPMSFWQAGRIVMHLAWPFSPPDNPPWTLKEVAVIQMIRLPRVLLATFVGMALGISGTALQGMMRNPLVGPDLVGVSAGAALGGGMAILFNLHHGNGTGVLTFAFLGGLGAMACTYSLTKLAQGSIEGVGLILAGIFISAFCMACVGLAQFLANDDQLANMMSYLLGTFAKAEPRTVWLLAVPTLAGGILLMLLRWRINLLSLGDLDAGSLGLNVQVLRWSVVAVVSFMIAAQVSVSGIIGWVGLVIPHCARMLAGPDHRRLLPASALLGALFTLAIDDFTRTIIRAEIPAGVMTTIIGTPIICFLFWRKKTKGWISE